MNQTARGGLTYPPGSIWTRRAVRRRLYLPATTPVFYLASPPSPPPHPAPTYHITLPPAARAFLRCARARVCCAHAPRARLRACLLLKARWQHLTLPLPTFYPTHTCLWFSSVFWTGSLSQFFCYSILHIIILDQLIGSLRAALRTFPPSPPASRDRPGWFGRRQDWFHA